MINSKDIIKLYFILNKLMYKYAILGSSIFNSKTKKSPKEDIKLLNEVYLAITILLEKNDNVIKDGEAYPFYGEMDSNEFNKLTDFFTYKFDLDPVPYMEFPKNTTKFISNESISVGGTGDGLPEGGGVGFYLTKNASGQVVWNDIDFIISDFNSL